MHSVEGRESPEITYEAETGSFTFFFPLKLTWCSDRPRHHLLAWYFDFDSDQVKKELLFQQPSQDELWELVGDPGKRDS